MTSGLISHIGIAVEDLPKAIKRYSLLLGHDPELVREIPDQKVRVAIFSSTEPASHGDRIELLTPTSDDSPVSKFLKKRGEGLHHVSIIVSDVETKLKEMKAAGFKLIDETPRIGAEGHRIAFVHPASTGGVLLELEEHPDS